MGLGTAARKAGKLADELERGAVAAAAIAKASDAIAPSMGTPLAGSGGFAMTNVQGHVIVGPNGQPLRQTPAVVSTGGGGGGGATIGGGGSGRISSTSGGGSGGGGGNTNPGYGYTNAPTTYGATGGTSTPLFGPGKSLALQQEQVNVLHEIRRALTAGDGGANLRRQGIV